MIRLAKYVLTGLIATAVDFGLFAFFVKTMHWPWFASASLSFFLSILAGHVMSIRFVFTSGARFRKHEEVFLILFISGVGLGINQFLLYFLVDMGFDPLLAKAGASCLVITWNFVIRYRFIFAPKVECRRST